MATIAFPSNPVLNQIYSYGDNTWIWDGSSWQLLTNGALNAVVIGNVVPQTGAFTALTADTFQSNSIVTGPIAANTVAANTVTAVALRSGNLSLSGNIVNPLRVDGSVQATGFTTVGNVIASGDVVSSSNVTAQFFIGDGSLLTNIPSGTVYSNANVASYLPTYSGELQAGNVSILGNILGNGISVLGQVAAAGNISGGNVNTAGMISATGNIAGRFLFGDARYLSNVPTNNYSNANVTSYLPTYTGNINASNYSGNGAGLTDLVAGNIVGTVANAVYATTAGTVVSVPAANIVGTVSAASTAALAGAALAVPGSGVSGAVALANVANSALVADQALSVSAANVVGTVANAAYANAAGAAATAVTVTANAQPNITSVGTLSALSVTGTATTGNVASRNLTLSGSAAVSGNVTAQYFFGNASQLTGLPVLNYSNANVAAYLPTYTGVVGASSITASGNIVGANIAASNQVTGLTVTAAGNIRGGNILSTGQISTSGNIAGAYLFGDARHLTNVPQNYSNANVAAYLPTYNGNINLATLSVTGNSVVSNLYVYGDEFSTENITVFGNVGAGNLNSSGAISSQGNVIAPFYFGDGRYLTNIPGGNYSNANVAAYLPTYTGNLSGDVLSVNLVDTNSVLTNTVNAAAGIVGASVTALGNVVGVNVNASGLISATGNVAGRFLFGDGRFISNIQGSYSNANVAAYLPTYTGALSGGSVSVTGNVSGGQIVGTSLSTSGNVSSDNVIVTGAVISGSVNTGTVTATGQISTTGNVIGNFFLGNGRFLSGLSTYSNANVAAFLATYSGDISADNMSLSGDVVGNNIYMYGRVFATTIVSAVGNVSGGNLTTPGWVSAQGNVRATYYFGDGRFLSNIQSNYNNANVAAFLPTYTGNLNPNIISASGNITAPYFFGNGSQLTGIQATEVGVLPSLSVTGNATIGNVNTAGNVTAAYFIGDGSQLTNLPATNYSNANVAAYLPTYTGVLRSSSVTASGNITAQYFVGNGSRLTGMYSNANVAAYLPTYTGNIAVNNVVASGNITAQYYVGNGSLLTGIQATEVGVLTNLTVTGNIDVGNVNVQGKASVDGNIITTKTVFSGNIVNSGSAQITGNVLAGNINVNGQISSAGNITAAVGNYFIGNGRFLTGLSSSGVDANTLTGNTLSSNVLYSSLRQVGVLTNLSVSGGVTADNLTTAGNVSAQGISTTGNITGDYIYGNGRQLSGIQATDVGTLPSLSVTGNINIGGYYIGDGGLLSNITVTTTYGNSNVAAFLPTYTGNLAGGNLSVSGNIVGNGLGIRSINAANVQGTVANATYAATAGVTNSANLAARVTANAQPNITSVGNLTSVTVTGNTQTAGLVVVGNSTSGNSTVTGNLSVLGNIFGNIQANLLVPGANTQVLYNLNGSAGANASFTFDNANKALAVGGTISASGNITGNLLLGNAALLSNVPSVLTVSNWNNGNIISNVIANVTTLRFNGNTGITVEEIGNAEALISLGSSFKTWEVAGQANLVAVGEDVVKFVAGPGIVITTDPLVYPQEIAFAANVSNISNGTSNITIVNNGNIRGVIGGSDSFTVDSTGFTAVGNIAGTYVVGNGAALTSVMADRGMDQNNWDTLTQMGVYTVNRASWSGTQGTPLDSQVYNGILEVKNTTNTGIAQVFYPGTVNSANSQVQWNRSYWSGSWSPWYYVVNNNNVVDAGNF